MQRPQKVTALKHPKAHSLLDSLFEGIVTGKVLLNLGTRVKLFAQGDEADAIYFIQTGKVQVTVASDHGKRAVLDTLGPGDFLGEECLIGDTLRTRTATSVAPSTVFRIQKRAMRQALHAQPRFSENFVISLLARNASLAKHLCDELFNHSEKRLARVLLKLSRFGQENDARNTKAPRLTHKVLADIVGTSSSKITVFMNKFRMLGLVDDRGVGDITVSRGLLTDVVLQD